MWSDSAREAAAAARAKGGSKEKAPKQRVGSVSGNTMSLGGGRYGIIGSDGKVRPVDSAGHVQAIADQHGIPTGHLANSPGGVSGSPSYVIRNKTTGEAVMETHNTALLSKINTDKYDMVSAHQHLAEVNNPKSLAGQWARRQRS